MARAEQIKTLVRSHAEGGDARIYAIPMLVAAQAARIGHGKFAQELHTLIDEARQRVRVGRDPRADKNTR